MRISTTDFSRKVTQCVADKSVLHIVDIQSSGQLRGVCAVKGREDRQNGE